MAKKIRDIAVKTGEYQDRDTGETKGRWQNVGSLMQNEDDKSLFVILERTFNPAGVPNPENRSSVILSCFVQQERQQGGQNGGGYNQGGGQERQGGSQGYDQSQEGGYGAGGQPSSRDLDDEIPFAPEWRA